MCPREVLRVETGSGGVHYLDFCEDYGSCSFSVVVFASDLKRIGDVGQLAGKTVEIRGEVKEYDGRAEIVLDDAKQLRRRGYAAAAVVALTEEF